MFNGKKIIDAHAHIYPQKIAEAAVRTVKRFYDNIERDYNVTFRSKTGELGELLQLAEEANVVKIVVSSVATNKSQVVSINNFLAASAESESRLIPFATLSPDMSSEELRLELARIKTLKLKGVKLHPDFQQFALDGGQAFKIFEELDGSLPVLMHTGDSRFNFSSPKQMVKAALKFNHITFICAHLGGWSEWNDLDGYLKTPNTFFDTSSAFMFLKPETSLKIIHALGVERCMFGTDYPMWNYSFESENIKKIGLTDEELDKILFENANKFFGQPPKTPGNAGGSPASY